MVLDLFMYTYIVYIMYIMKSGGLEQARQMAGSCFKLVGSHQHNVHVHMHEPL